jgi:hypothetical protein
MILAAENARERSAANVLSTIFAAADSPAMRGSTMT